MKYRVICQDGFIVCYNVDKDCAKAICQFLNFLINTKVLKMSMTDIKVTWEEPSVMKEADGLRFIQD